MAVKLGCGRWLLLAVVLVMACVVVAEEIKCKGTDETVVPDKLQDSQYVIVMEVEGEIQADLSRKAKVLCIYKGDDLPENILIYDTATNVGTCSIRNAKQSWKYLAYLSKSNTTGRYQMTFGTDTDTDPENTLQIFIDELTECSLKLRLPKDRTSTYECLALPTVDTCLTQPSPSTSLPSTATSTTESTTLGLEETEGEKIEPVASMDQGDKNHGNQLTVLGVQMVLGVVFLLVVL
ncbi:uncharacterized protein LOC131948068 [Physella acuta]|uniref:uncharacterized protein LOC131948068 n=1 Tax=Physella acuta TaxID=109671 RepID=UPI0027DCCAE9|nr:uncharacterized protein LOC131948068 [Physella acuta]XP_059165538.1 uncharacterized protein LOC131948068 [Physella acuta]XP_059165539.1 uncharacterized protein LOC131948068 [Physella acuta]